MGSLDENIDAPVVLLEWKKKDGWEERSIEVCKNLDTKNNQRLADEILEDEAEDLKLLDEFEKVLKAQKKLHTRDSFDAIQSTWLCLIFRELRRLNENLETPLSTPKRGVDKRKGKESARARIEATFEKPLRELLAERKGKTVREIASEFGVSKTLVSRWRKESRKVDG